MNSVTGKLVLHACCAASSAFVFGFFLVRTIIKDFDSLDFSVVLLSGFSVMFVLFWTYSAIRRLPTTETTKKSAVQYLWSCIFFSMLSLRFGYGGIGLELV